MTKPVSFRPQQWKMLLATMFCYLFFYTGRHNFGWAAKGMAADLNISFSLIGWISFAMLIGYAVGQLINGNLADHYSPWKMILIGAVLSVAANFAISFSRSYTLSPDLLREKYVGTGVGIMNMCAYLFAASGEPLLGFIIDSTQSTSSVFMAIIFICLACAAIISTINKTYL